MALELHFNVNATVASIEARRCRRKISLVDHAGSVEVLTALTARLESVDEDWRLRRFDELSEPVRVAQCRFASVQAESFSRRYRCRSLSCHGKNHRP
jgi:hypothetical protein